MRSLIAVNSSFECRDCTELHERSGIDATNCTTIGSSLDAIDVRPGYWRQSVTSQFVRECPFEDACEGGTAVGDESCATGHRGPLCDICQHTPDRYFGGRGKACVQCPSVRDSAFAIVLTAVAFVLFLAGCAMAYYYVSRRGLSEVATNMSKTLVQKDAKDIATGKLAEKARAKALATEQKAHEIGRQVSGTRGQDTPQSSSDKPSLLMRVFACVGNLGVKIKILISLCQVLSEVGDTYEIVFPDFYTATLEQLSYINVPIGLLPFGCLFSDLNNILFDLVLITAVPLGLVVALVLLSKYLHSHYQNQPDRGMTANGQKGTGLVMADLCSDLWFFIIFIMYPTTSLRTFQFFMVEVYDGPGEDGSSVMVTDRSVAPHRGSNPGFAIRC
jgi:hypothetical protein